MYFLFSLKEGIMGVMRQGTRTLFFSLDTLIYKFIINAYEMFNILCSGRLLSNELLNKIATRVGLILGIIMFLRIGFAFIQMILEPDKVNDKEAGAYAIIKKVIIVIIMLGLSSSAFETLYKIQKNVVTSNIISNILLPYTIKDENGKDGTENFGRILSMELLTSFYEIDPTLSDNTSQSDELMVCANTMKAFKNQIYTYGEFDLGYNCLNETVQATNSAGASQETFIINFNWLFSAIAGFIVLYLLLMYCFSIGIRMIQLAVLEVISPMAIVSYLSPKKDNMLSKWTKIYISTYIDVFIRIAIINFVVFLLAAIFDSNDGASGVTIMNTLNFPNSTTLGTNLFINVVIIISLLTFAKNAPDLIKRLIPTSESKLSFMPQIKDMVGLSALTGGVLGGGVGALVGVATGGPIGLLTGAFRGGTNGIKSKNLGGAVTGAASKQFAAQMKANKKMADIRANGGNWLGSHIAAVQSTLGMRNAYERDEETLAELKSKQSLFNEANSEAESEAIKNGSNYIMQSYDGRTHSLTELDKLRNQDGLDSAAKEAYEREYNSLKKSATMFNLDYGAAVENGNIQFDRDGNLEQFMTADGNIKEIHEYQNANGQGIDYQRLNSDIKGNGTLGATNAKIEVRISKLTGQGSGAGRGKVGKEIRNNASAEEVRITNSDKYQKNKANAGK